MEYERFFAELVLRLDSARVLERPGSGRGRATSGQTGRDETGQEYDSSVVERRLDGFRRGRQAGRDRHYREPAAGRSGARIRFFGQLVGLQSTPVLRAEANGLIGESQPGRGTWNQTPLFPRGLWNAVGREFHAARKLSLQQRAAQPVEHGRGSNHCQGTVRKLAHQAG